MTRSLAVKGLSGTKKNADLSSDSDNVPECLPLSDPETERMEESSNVDGANLPIVLIMIFVDGERYFDPGSGEI